MQRIRADKEDGFWKEMANTEAASTAFDSSIPLQMGDAQRWNEITGKRLGAP